MDTALMATPLSELSWHSYVTPEGLVNPIAAGKIGVYGVANQLEVIQYIGFSRDIYLSLRQHLIRQPQACYFFKFLGIERPSRTELDRIRQQWLGELDYRPVGNGAAQPAWEHPIDVKATMTAEMLATWSGLDELAQIKYLKDLARQKEAEILQALAERQITEPLRFNPKLKENGLLDLK